MRDIRDDLKARRAAVVGRYGDAMHEFQVALERLSKNRRDAIERFENEKATLDDMIAMEDHRFAGESGDPVAVAPSLSLRTFLVTRIEGDGPIDKDQLRAESVAAGYTEGGRAFNMTLQNIASGGSVKKLPDGRYARRDAPSGLFGADQLTGEAPMTTQLS